MIEPSQHHAAYLVGLDHHDGKLGIAEALRRLAPTGINRGSAQFLVYGVTHLLRGECYTRALSIQATDDYLTWIRRDRGDSALANGLKALKLHIDYYEDIRKTHRPGLHELLAKHSALLADPADATILMEWMDRESAGFIDVFPLKLFAAEDELPGVVIEVRVTQGRIHFAKCDVTVAGLSADLNFEPYSDFNERQGMLLGVARLEFEDSDRTSIRSARWKPHGSSTFVVSHIECHAFEVPPAPDYLPPEEPSDKTPRLVRERPGQAVFRRSLKSVYRNRCCISGCSVPQVLEGAHIDGYLSLSSDNVRNGLLLRCDLHALFDRHLISINPSTLQVHVAAVACVADGYATLQGANLTLPVHPSHRPDPAALERHWRRFQTA